MMKQEFDKIAAELGYTECDLNMYEKEIEPTYMLWADDYQLQKEEMVRMYWGVEKGDYNVWLELNGAYHAVVTRKAAWEAVKKEYKDAGMKVPEGIEKEFTYEGIRIDRRVNDVLFKRREKKAVKAMKAKKVA